jgi:nicotinate-nucleotide adenylyltransferase
MQPAIGLLGGSFDPVHVGHLALAVNARAALGLEEVWLIPARTPPHKRGRRLTDARHRLAMLRRAVRGLPGLRVCTIELERPGPSYTVETVRALRRAQPGRYVLLVGADMALDLPRWREARALLRMVEVAAAPRPGWTLPPRVRRIPAPSLDVSSREIRARAKRGLPITFLVTPEVERYILRHGLYR